MKKEKIQEYAENFWLNDNTMSDLDKDAYIKGFTAGVEHHQENSYSEKDMINMFHYGHQVGANSILSIQSQLSSQPVIKPDLEILKKELLHSLKKK